VKRWKSEQGSDARRAKKKKKHSREKKVGIRGNGEPNEVWPTGDFYRPGGRRARKENIKRKEKKWGVRGLASMRGIGQRVKRDPGEAETSPNMSETEDN